MWRSPAEISKHFSRPRRQILVSSRLEPEMRIFVIASVALIAAAQQAPETTPAPKIEFADIHPSQTRNVFMRGIPATRGGRLTIKNATMVDLIRIAYGFSPDKILEGPNWLEMDHFELTAKLPQDAKAADQKPMLEALLADRFHLVVRKENRPLPAYALVVGKKPLLKEADGSGNTGCKPKAASGPPGPGMMMIGINGVQIALGPGGVIEFNCRNITMADFAAGLRGMFGTDLGQNPVTDETGLKGIWNFDVHWSLGFIGMPMESGDRVTTPDAIERQLGLKLEKRQVPTPVLVVVSVDRKPTANPQGTAEALPPINTPVEFEVADVKPAAPGGRGGAMRNQPGGKLVVNGMAMRILLMRAFGSTFNQEEVVGIPDWANNARYDITAKASVEPGQMQVDQESMNLMIRSLLEERFKLKWHTEERPQTAYTLVAVKPKMKKADPAERASCKNEQAPAGSPPGSTALVCHDVTMEQFAETLEGAAQGLDWPVTDSTELAGGWDFTLNYSRFPQMTMGPGRGGGDGGIPGSPLPMASDPSGAYTIFEAIEKQLGLKLVPHKRNLPVYVIDNLEQVPTDN
jgi:uncharacterized protein (TIGR03435 family)